MSSIPVFPSPIPAPGSQQDSFFSSPCPSEAGRDAKHPAAGRTTFSRFPFPPATHPTERQTEQFYPGAGQPPLAHIFGRLTLQCFHCLSTVPSSTWLTDPKLPPSAAAPCPKREARALLLQLQLQLQLQNGPLSPGFFGQQKYQSKAQSEQVTDVPAPCLDRPSCPYSNPKL